MSILDFFRRKADDAPAPQEDRARLFSTHREGGVTSSQIAGQIMARLNAAAPKVSAEAAAAMDGLDLTRCTPADLMTPSITDALFSWYGLQSFIGPQLCALLLQHWLIQKACAMPARDAVRHGYDIHVPDGTADKIKDEIREADKRFAIKRQMVEFVRLGRGFGIRIALFLVDSEDADYYKNPFNIDGVAPGKYRGIKQIDPYWVTPQFDGISISDPTSESFYEPTWWMIMGKLYHKSHLCIFRTAQPPDMLKPSYYYGGVPVPQMIMERVYAAERTANEAPQLANSKRLTVWNTDLSHVLMNQDKFATHMQNFAAFRDNYGVKMIDSEDQMAVHDTTLTGLDDLISGQYELVAAAAGVPVTKLMGTTPKGMNSSGGYEESSYHEELETIQENDLTPLLDRHHQLLAKSEFDGIAIRHEWEPLDSPDAKEYAEINYTNAQSDALLAEAGAIDGEDIRNRIRTSPDTGYTGISADVPEPDPLEADPTVKPTGKSGKIDPNG